MPKDRSTQKAGFDSSAPRGVIGSFADALFQKRKASEPIASEPIASEPNAEDRGTAISLDVDEAIAHFNHPNLKSRLKGIAALPDIAQATDSVGTSTIVEALTTLIRQTAPAGSIEPKPCLETQAALQALCQILTNSSGDPSELGVAHRSPLNLAHANLCGVDLSGANLEQANLKGADLTGANLSRANLNGANLKEATLHQTNFNKAQLVEADLSFSRLTAVNFDQANAVGAKLVRTVIATSSFNAADFSNANFSLSDLKGTRLAQTNLSGANFHRATLTQVDLRASDLSHANLGRAKLARVRLKAAKLNQTRFDRTMLLRVDCSDTEGLTIQPSELGAQDLFLCDVRLPENYQDIPPNRDCVQFPYLLINEGFFKDIDTAEAHLKQMCSLNPPVAE